MTQHPALTQQRNQCNGHIVREKKVALAAQARRILVNLPNIGKNTAFYMNVYVHGVGLVDDLHVNGRGKQWTLYNAMKSLS